MRLPPRTFVPILRNRRRLALRFWLLLGAVYAIVFLVADRLMFVLDRDELHFWPTSVGFSGHFDLSTLRQYSELNTPLCFIIFGQFARFSEHGLWLARCFNLALSACVLVLIAYARGRVTLRSLLASAGLITCAYFILFSTHVYSDTIAAFCVSLGLWLQLRGRFLGAASAWTLAIATRQYMVAFPLAVAGWEYFRPRPSARHVSCAWVLPLIAAASLAAWMILFGGLVPPNMAVGVWPADRGRFFLDHSLYFVTCVGVYYGIPNLLIFGWTPRLNHAFGVRTMVLAIILALMFAIAPPLKNSAPYVSTMGYLDKGAHWMVDGFPAATALRVTVFYACALWTVLRFAHASLATWLVASNAAVMIGAPQAWDKYVVPLVCTLWLLDARPRCNGICRTRPCGSVDLS